MSFITAAIIAGGAGIAGSAISASGARSAAAAASDANARNVAATNALNEKLFNQSRGAVGDDGFGHSILPVYFGGNEQQFGQSAYDNYSRLTGAANNSYNNLLGYQGQLQGSLGASFGAINNRFNGQDLAQRVGYANPFFDSRMSQAQTYGQGLNQVAAANSSSISTGLAQQLAAMNAARGAQGYFGNSTFDRNRALAATLAARQSAAVTTAQAGAQGNDAMAAARFANAGDLRGLQTQNLDFMSRPDLLQGAMQAGAGFEGVPGSYLANAYTQAQSPLNFFRIQPQAFQAQNMPTVDPQINNSQIFGSMLSQAGQAYGNYSLGQYLNQTQGPAQVNPYFNASYAAQSGLAQQPQLSMPANFTQSMGYSQPNYSYLQPSSFSMPYLNTSLYAPRPNG